MVTALLIVIAVAIIAYFAAKDYIISKKNIELGKDMAIIRVTPERGSERTVEAVKHFWQVFHSIEKQKPFGAKPRMSMEIRSYHDERSKKEEIAFYFVVPREYESIIRANVAGAYPRAEIEKIKQDYAPATEDTRTRSYAEFMLQEHYAFPMRVIDDFEDVDPMRSILASMSQIEDGEEIIFQAIFSPAPSGWQAKAGQILHRYEKTGSRPAPKRAVRDAMVQTTLGAIVMVIDVVLSLFSLIISGPTRKNPPSQQGKQNPGFAEKEEQEKIAYKYLDTGFSVTLRAIALSPLGVEETDKRIKSLGYSFEQMRGANILIPVKPEGKDEKEFFNNLKLRQHRSDADENILSSAEMASFMHLPTKWTRINTLTTVGTAILPPPPGLSRMLPFVTYRDREIGMLEQDRYRHVYVSGKTGTGKTTMLARMIIQDINDGRGVFLLDPHGDLARTVMASITTERQDIYILDPSLAASHPPGLNLLEVNAKSNDPVAWRREKSLVVSSFITLLKGVFGRDMIGPSSEDILRNAAELVLSGRRSASMLDILFVLEDADFAAAAIARAGDKLNPVVDQFWKGFPKLRKNDKYMADRLQAPLNKLRKFLGDDIIAPIIDQSESSFNIRQIMDAGGVFIANLCIGDWEEQNSKLLGRILLSKIQIAAMSRADIPEHRRVPTTVYIDEFQNFIDEDSVPVLSSLLSEARKFRVSIVFANQFLEQLTDDIRSAVFGNVGTIVTFRCGPEDAAYLEKLYYDEERDFGFMAADLQNLRQWEVAIRMELNGMMTQPFLATSLPLPGPHRTASVEILRERQFDLVPKTFDQVQQEVRNRLGNSKLMSE